MGLKKSQQELWKHSKAKVELLRLYLEQYINILNQTPFIKKVYIYDLFCGEGIYPNGGKGSPIIIVESLKQIRTSQNPATFEVLFNDSDSTKILKLKANIDSLKPLPSTIAQLKFKTENYRSFLPEIVSDLISSEANSRAFIFLDPYRYSDIQFEDIKNLLISEKTEVLLFLPTQFMFRFERKGRPKSLHKFIEELIPENQWPNSHTGIDFIENLTNAFMHKLGHKHFVDSFIITRDVNQFFCLFFFTSHPYGFETMLNAKWLLDEKEGRGWSPPKAPSLFDSVESNPKTEQFKDLLFGYLSEQPRNNIELYRFTLQHRHLTAHTNQILTDLQMNDHIAVTNPDGTPARKRAFFVSYKYFKDQLIKIIVKLNK